MKKLSVTLLIVMLMTTSCATNRGKNEQASEPSILQPKPLDDDWSQSLLGEWEGSGESSAGTGKGWMKIEMALNDQFLVITGESEVTEITPEQKKYLKEIMHVSDENIARFKGSTFKYTEFRTTDSENGEIIAYLFDSMRCVAKGTGRIEENKETIQWKWSVGGQGVSTRITEKISNDKFIITEKYTFPDGNTMEDNWRIVRKK